MCCLLPVLKRMGFHTRAWQYSISPTLPFFSLSPVETPEFSGVVAGNISPLWKFLHTRIMIKNYCVLYSLLTSTIYLQPASWERLGVFGNVSDICLLNLAPGMSPWEVFHEPCSSEVVLECMYSAEGRCVWRRRRKYSKNIRDVSCTVESSWQVELAAVDLHIINLLGVFTPAFYCSTTQHMLV